MRLPTPKLPTARGEGAAAASAAPRPAGPEREDSLRIRANLMPTPRVPGGSPAVPPQRPRPPRPEEEPAAAALLLRSTTAALKDSVFRELPKKSPSSSDLRSRDTVMGRRTSSRGNSPPPRQGAAAQQGAAIERVGMTYECVARHPGAVDVVEATVEDSSLVEKKRTALVVARVNDTALVGGFGDSSDLAVVGLELVGITQTPHQVEVPETSPTSLAAAVRLLGPDAPRAAYPLYLQLRPLGLVERDRVKLRLQRVLVVTNREPVITEDNKALFAVTLTDTASTNKDRDESGVFWGLVTVGYREHTAAEGELLAEVAATKGVDRTVSDYHYLSWEPMARARALDRLRQEAPEETFVYCHGYNTTLQFAARTAAHYAQAFNKPHVVCFAWPSNPPLLRNWAISAVLSVADRNYYAAEQMCHRSVENLAQVARTLRAALPENTRISWKAHSMGNYLLLSAMKHVAATAATAPRLAETFGRIILDAPDTPTWFFVDEVRRAAQANVRFLHLFNAKDKATEISRQRRGLEYPAPGNGSVLVCPGLYAVDCTGAKSGYGYHDYGRLDPTVLAAQRAFLSGDTTFANELVPVDTTPALWALPPARRATVILNS